MTPFLQNFQFILASFGFLQALSRIFQLRLVGVDFDLAAHNHESGPLSLPACLFVCL